MHLASPTTAEPPSSDATERTAPPRHATPGACRRATPSPPTADAMPPLRARLRSTCRAGASRVRRPSCAPWPRPRLGPGSPPGSNPCDRQRRSNWDLRSGAPCMPYLQLLTSVNVQASSNRSSEVARAGHPPPQHSSSAVGYRCVFRRQADVCRREPNTQTQYLPGLSVWSLC